MSCLETIELQTIPIVVCQGPIHQHASWPSKPILGHGKRLQVFQNTHVSKGNLGVETVTCFFCQHVGCQFKHYPFVDDRLRLLLRDC